MDPHQPLLVSCVCECARSLFNDDDDHQVASTTGKKGSVKRLQFHWCGVAPLAHKKKYKIKRSHVSLCACVPVCKGPPASGLPLLFSISYCQNFLLPPNLISSSEMMASILTFVAQYFLVFLSRVFKIYSLLSLPLFWPSITTHTRYQMARAFALSLLHMRTWYKAKAVGGAAGPLRLLEFKMRANFFKGWL